ncbi:MAG: DNA polymerase/3'-5' exonuclease PolX [Nitrospirota bacterium]
MTNTELARVMREIGVFLDMQSVPFKPRAYEKAAYAIEALEEPLVVAYRREGRKALDDIPGVGKSMAEKLITLIETGRLPYYDELRKQSPIDVAGLSAIEGLGPKMMKALYDALGVRNVEELERAAKAGKIRELPHFGERSEEKILQGISFLKAGGGRFLLGAVLPVIHQIEERLVKMKGVERVAVAGSIRRRKETIGDGDLLAVSSKPEQVMEAFIAMPEVVHVHAKGATKSSVRLDTGMDVDLRVIPAESFGAALLYFTGSKSHNIVLRKLAQSQHLKLSEYGLFRGERAVAGRTEEGVYAALGLPYIPPELREDAGEIDAALAGALPELVEYGDLRGDLQVQTNWTDGANTIEEMAEAARRAGLEYIAITDHTKSLAMTRGADEEKLRRQMAAIDRFNATLRDFRVLKGAEVNIKKDGTLDIADDALAELEVVGAAVHSHFHLSRAEMTRRIVRAIENPHVDILFHPTGRILNRREAYELNLDEIIRAAKRTGTALEIDAYPDRLDLKDEHVRRAVEAGVKLVIDSDAHSVHHFGALPLGLATARRGWAKKSDILNTQPVGRFLHSLKGAARRREKGVAA